MQPNAKSLRIPTGAVIAVFFIAAGAALWAAYAGPPGTAQGARSAHTYALRYVKATEVEAQLRHLLQGTNAEVSVAVDGAANQLVIEANEAGQKIVSDFLRQIDVPAAPAAGSTLRAYPVAAEQIDATVKRLEERLAKTPGVRVAIDRRSNQLLVLATPTVHLEITKFLDTTSEKPSNAAANITRTRQKVTLKSLDNARLPEVLKQYGGKGVKTSLDPATGELTAVLPAANGQEVLLTASRDVKEVTLNGPAGLVHAWQRILETVDRPRTSPTAQTQLVALKNADRQNIRRAVAALGPPETPLEEEKKEEDPAKPAEPTKEGEAPKPATPATPTLVGDDELGAGGLIGPVQIEFLEGLDVIVVRGNKKDVDRVLKIIAQIEAVDQPIVEIRMMKNVDCRSMADLINTLYADILSARAGRVAMTPLIKPNALLLIGRAENIKTIIELIERLDQPVDPATEFRVFQLTHIPVLDAERTTNNFFISRGGLSPKVLVVSDYRSNALIVWASPRDLEEVARLLKEIDIPSAKATQELKVFPLKNSLATELAPTLQSAITGQASGQRTQTPGLTPGGAAPGVTQPAQINQQGAGATSPRASMLTFTTIDADGRRILKSGILTDVRITADPRANSILVSGPAESMPLIAALIAQLDQLPTAEASIKVFTIINGDATALITMLQNLFGQATGNQQNNQFGPATTSAGGENMLVPLRFAVDQRTNSIIATGAGGDLRVVEAILLRLDANDTRQRKSVVYRLRHAPAADVATAINNFLTSQRQVLSLNPTGTSPFEQIEREVIVVPEPVSNSLILSATPRYFDEVSKIVEELDAQPPMVMIQVLLAEVQLGSTHEFGVELGIQDSLLFDRSVVGADTNVPGFNFNNQPLGNSNSPASLATREYLAGQALTNFAVGRTNSELGYGGLVLSASSESLSILIRALQDFRRLDILSRPQVMTLDNQPAFVQIGSRVPRITSTQVTQTGTVNSIDYDNVGILLGVTPRVSPDGLVVMEIDAERSEVGPEAEGIPISINQNGDVIRSPQIRTTTAQTTVSARSGQTVVLGGLITKNNTTASRRVPFLSDIPLLGNFFRYDLQSERRTELLIIMTPHVVRKDEDADAIKQVESQRMSWCLADVTRVHGDIGVTPSDPWCFAEGETIYPDDNPAGMELIPAPGGARLPTSAQPPYGTQPKGTQPPAYGPGYQPGNTPPATQPMPVKPLSPGDPLAPPIKPMLDGGATIRPTGVTGAMPISVAREPTPARSGSEAPATLPTYRHEATPVQRPANTPVREPVTVSPAAYEQSRRGDPGYRYEEQPSRYETDRFETNADRKQTDRRPPRDRYSDQEPSYRLPLEE